MEIVGRNNLYYAQFVLKFYELFKNLCDCGISEFISKEITESLDKFLNNYMRFSLINLYDFLEVVYEKEGYAFLDFKGNFSKTFVLTLNF